MQIVKGYLQNDALRKSFNTLANSCFGIDFEPWYANGFWSGKYIPHSIVVDGEVVANVAVSQMETEIDGKTMHLYQIGTVMTAKEHRNRGYSRKLMEYVMEKYQNEGDGVFLFANRTVLDFYPKFGFERAVQYKFSKQVNNDGASYVEKVDNKDPSVWEHLIGVYHNNRFESRIRVKNNHQLLMFYIPMMDVYYHEPTDTYIVADLEDGKLFIYDIFSSTDLALEKAIAFFGDTVKKVTLGFTPKNTEQYSAEPISAQEDAFFGTGKILELTKEEKINIPYLFHA